MIGGDPGSNATQSLLGRLWDHFAVMDFVGSGLMNIICRNAVGPSFCHLKPVIPPAGIGIRLFATLSLNGASKGHLPWCRSWSA